MDIFLTVCIGVLQAAIAILGIRVSLKPLAAHHHGRFIAAFLILGILGIVLNVIQQKRNGNAQHTLQAQIDRIEKNTKTPPSVQVTNNIPPAQVINNPGAPIISVSDRRSVVLDCSMRPLPVAYRSSLNFLDPQWGGVGSMLNAPGATSDAYWPSQSTVGFGYRCELINDSKSVEYNASIELSSGTGEIVTMPGGAKTEGAVKSAQKVNISAARLEPNGGKLEFYIVHSGVDFVKVQVPDIATVEDVNGTKRIVPLKKLNAVSRSTMSVFPFENRP